MRRAVVGRGANRPFRIEPALGQVPEDCFKVVVPAEESGDVLEKSESWAGLSNDSDGVWPAIPLIIGRELLPGDREWWAWEAGSDDIHSATIGSSVERSHIREDWGVVEEAIPDSGSEHSLAVFISFDISDRSPP